MTITTTPGCSWSPSTQYQTGSFDCVITATMNSSGCVATLTNESFQTNCDDSNYCVFTEVNNITQNLSCDGNTFTIITAIGPSKVTSNGSCTCGAAAANASNSTTGNSTQATPSSDSSTPASGSSSPASGSSSSASGSSAPASGSSTPTSGSSTLVRTSTALLMVYVVAFSIVGNI